MRSNPARFVSSRRWSAALVLSAAVLGVTAGPAAATHTPPETGSAAGAGTETINAEGSGLPTCLLVSDDSFYTIAATGIVTANSGSASSIYGPGPLTIVLDPDEPYYINPAGVFSDSACLSPGVSAEIRVTSPGGEVSSCGSGDATYLRADTVVSYSGTGDCTVNGVQAGADTLHTFEGNLLPCFGDDVTCGATQIEGVYTES